MVIKTISRKELIDLLLDKINEGTITDELMDLLNDLAN